METRTIRIVGDLQKFNAIEAIKNTEPDKDRPMVMTLAPEVKKKSPNQRDYWHVVVRQLGNELGYTEKEMKSVLKEELLPKITRRRLDGTEFDDVPSTEELSMRDYSDLIDGTLRLAAEQGVILVDPRL